MIKLNNIWKEYIIDEDNVFTALKGVNVTIEDGEFVAIIGPSGSGKSTLMHIIGLLDKPSRGSIYINGQETSRMNDDAISQLRSEAVGFVFQQFNLIQKLTVLENVLLPTIYARKKLAFDREKRAVELLARFGLESKIHSYPNKISGGQQQRVAIARALIMKPNLILADEPTGNLDQKTGQDIMKLLTELNAHDKVTVTIVTHDNKIAEQTNRIIRIVDGNIV